MEKYVGYRRVSTDEQVKNGSGLEVQEDVINTYCKKNKIKSIKIFTDEGVSGANDINKRKGLNALINYVKLNKIEYVLVTKMDRVARDTYIQIWFERELFKYNSKMISIQEDGLNADDYMTKAMRQMGAVFAELDKNRIVDRLTSGRRKKAEKGGKPSGYIAFGYKKENNIIVIDKEQSEIIKRIYNLYLTSRSSLQKIADLLNEEGVITKHNKVWSKQSVRVLLTNKFYVGTIVYDDIEVEGKHEPIMNKVTFGKVQSKLIKNRRRPA